MPTSDMELPSWADTFVNTWLELFWDETWKGEDEAIAILVRSYFISR
ncbi:hypothetical protein [Hydrocoleum sp. CS-953]|nr:hypothetical protein [Hydrocoleum sp. CS-953]